MRTLLLAIVGLALAGCQRKAALPAFESVALELPAGQAMLPPGPEVEVVSENCLSCHSAEMITTQPRLTEAQWQAEVDKMVKVYKAPIDADDRPAIVEYLVATNTRRAS